nr:MAG TPA: hypothetical protein [Herelleviridae sp.]
MDILTANVPLKYSSTFIVEGSFGRPDFQLSILLDCQIRSPFVKMSSPKSSPMLYSSKYFALTLVITENGSNTFNSKSASI